MPALYASFVDPVQAEEAAAALLDHGVQSQEISLLSARPYSPAAAAAAAAAGVPAAVPGPADVGDTAIYADTAYATTAGAAVPLTTPGAAVADRAAAASNRAAADADLAAAGAARAAGATGTAARLDSSAAQHLGAAAAQTAPGVTAVPGAPGTLPDRAAFDRELEAHAVSDYAGTAPVVPVGPAATPAEALAAQRAAEEIQARRIADSREVPPVPVASVPVAPAAVVPGAVVSGAVPVAAAPVVSNAEIREREVDAKTGLTITTPADAAAGAAKGAGWGLGVGILAGLASLFIPGVGLVVGAGALATAVGAMAATTAAGAIAGGVAGYLQDQGVPEEAARTYHGVVSGGGAMLAVHLPAGNLDGSEMERLLRKYGATNIAVY